MHPSDIIGSIAAIAMVFGYLPQTVRTVRTRSTDDIATGTFLMMGFGSRSTTTISKRDGRRPSHDIDENL